MMQYCYSPNFWCSIQESIPNIIYWWASVCSKPSMDDREGLPPILVLNGGGGQTALGNGESYEVSAEWLSTMQKKKCMQAFVCVRVHLLLHKCNDYISNKEKRRKKNKCRNACIHAYCFPSLYQSHWWSLYSYLNHQCSAVKFMSWH